MKGKRQEEEGFNAETAEAQRTQRRKEKGTGKGQSGTLPAGRYGGGDTPVCSSQRSPGHALRDAFRLW